MDCFACGASSDAVNAHQTNVASTGKNPFEGYIPEVPDGERMDFGSESFVENERQGVHPQLANMLQQH